ncbi:ankyrin repeat domain-containing protein [Blastomonas sp.]|uniref:ankyrin repeat domain-containing protein n=1 Tax=Blastomonas sp. TaxID=1909299 RepID=UPI0035940B80
MLSRIAAGRTDLVFDWIEGGGDALATFDGAALINWCSYFGDVSAIRFLQSRGVSLALLGSNFDLNGAAFHGHWRLCEYLIEQGANPQSALPDTGETPLHAALSSFASAEHECVVKVLLAAGAEVNAVTNPGVETGSFMRDVRTRGETALHRAAAYGTLESIRLLIEAGGALDARDANDDSPLSWASYALRDASVLHMLCFPPFHVNANRRSMRSNLIGTPVKT